MELDPSPDLTGGAVCPAFRFGEVYAVAVIVRPLQGLGAVGRNRYVIPRTQGSRINRRRGRCAGRGIDEYRYGEAVRGRAVGIDKIPIADGLLIQPNVGCEDFELRVAEMPILYPVCSG